MKRQGQPRKDRAAGGVVVLFASELEKAEQDLVRLGWPMPPEGRERARMLFLAAGFAASPDHDTGPESLGILTRWAPFLPALSFLIFKCRESMREAPCTLRIKRRGRVTAKAPTAARAAKDLARLGVPVPPDFAGFWDRCDPQAPDAEAFAAWPDAWCFCLARRFDALHGGEWAVELRALSKATRGKSHEETRQAMGWHPQPEAATRLAQAKRDPRNHEVLDKIEGASRRGDRASVGRLEEQFTSLIFGFSREAVKLARALPSGVKVACPRIGLDGPGKGIDDVRAALGTDAFVDYWAALVAAAEPVPRDETPEALALRLLKRENPETINKAIHGKLS